MSQEFLQQIPEEQTSCNVSSTIQNVRRKCMRTGVVENVDLFSIPVNLNINGGETHQTKFGGCVHLCVIVFCIWLTMITFFQNGLYLSSSINQVLQVVDDGDIGASIFDYFDIPIRINITKNGDYVSFNKSIYVFAYWVTNDNVQNLTISGKSQCIYDEFCIMKKYNPSFDIYGPEKTTSITQNFTQPFSRIVMQFFMCNAATAGCTTWSTSTNRLTVKLPYFQPIRGGYIGSLRDKVLEALRFDNSINIAQLDRLYIQNNNKFFGHLGNFFPQKKAFRTLREIAPIQANSQPHGYYTNKSALTIHPLYRGQLYIASSGKTYTSHEIYDDVSSIILFFLSIKETIYFLVIFLLVARYNYNSAFLEIADNLYTMDDHQNCNKYDFQSGGSVVLACILYKHPICKVFNFILKFKGLTINDLVPHKCLCAMMMINKTEQILCEKTFFEGLEQLSGLEDLPPKKIVLNDPGEVQQQVKQTKQEEDEQQLQYFPNDKIRSQAFTYFCQKNSFYNPNRKNYIYRILTDKSLQLSLPHLLKKQFEYYVKNVEEKTNDGLKFGCYDLEKQDVIPIQLDKMTKTKRQQQKQQKEYMQLEESSAINMIKPNDNKGQLNDLQKLMRKEMEED